MLAGTLTNAIRQPRLQDDHPAPVKEPGLLADLWDIARIPLLLALLAVAATWMVWYFTVEPGDPQSARPTGCDWDSLEKCFSLNLVNKMFTHGAIAGGTGGVSFYIMLRRERLARQAAERRADEERQRANEVQRRADEERQRADEERQRLIDRILELTAPANGSRAPTDSET